MVNPSVSISRLLAVLAAVAALAASGTAQQFVDLGQSKLQTQNYIFTLGDPAGLPSDLDGDGDVDVLLRVGTLLRNRGNLDFTLEPLGQSIPPLGLFGHVETAADVDGDGILDLLMLQVDLFGNQSHVAVLFGQPGGTWSAPQRRGTAFGLRTQVATSDIDGDGDIDLQFSGSGTALLTNDGTGTFTDVTGSQLPLAFAFRLLASTDLDRDGDNDMLCVTGGSLLQVLRNDGAGTFTPDPSTIVTLSPQWAKAALGDLDADGDTDLIVASSSGLPMQAYFNDGSGQLRPIVLALPLPASPTQSLVFRDLDADGFADLLAIDNQPAGVVLQPYRNIGGALFQAAPQVQTDFDPSLAWIGDPGIADLDGDGDLDLVVGGTAIYLNAGNLDFRQLRRRALPILQGSTSSLAAGDLDGDGVRDLLLGTALVHGEGDGSFGPAQPVAALGPSMPTTALLDADNDGDLDIAFVGQATSGVLLNQAGAFTPMLGFPSPQMRGSILTADFDNDGRTDLLSSLGVVLPNLVGGGFGVGPTVPALLLSAVAADIDGDTRIDLVANTGGAFQVLRNLGAFTFQSGFTQTLSGLQSVAAADFDGDGRTDIATAVNPIGSALITVQVWRQQPNGTFLATTTSAQGANVSLLAADFDQDGDVDLYAGRMLVNDGAGNLTAQAESQFGASMLADLDDDGDLDVVASTNSRNATVVLLNRHRQLFAPRQPMLGGHYEVQVSSRPGYGAPTLAQVAVSAARIAPLQLGSLGTLRIDPATAFFGPVGTTGTDGVCTFAMQVPNDPALAGLDVYWQGIVAEPNGPRLTGFLHDRVQ